MFLRVWLPDRLFITDALPKLALLYAVDSITISLKTDLEVLLKASSGMLSFLSKCLVWYPDVDKNVFLLAMSQACTASLQAKDRMTVFCYRTGILVPHPMEPRWFE